MEPGEEITEAAIREVKEETGLDFEPSTLLSVEAAGKHFTFYLLQFATICIGSRIRFSPCSNFKCPSSIGGSWYRFVVGGDVTGGRLKTPADADAESLQAKWISDLAELSLRANDVVPLVDRGRAFAMRRPNDPWYELQVRIMQL